MDVQILKKIWGEDNYVFTPLISGWLADPKTGKLTAETFREGPGRTPSVAIDRLLKNLDETKMLNHRVDVYFCPVEFNSAKRSKANAVDKLAVLWADLDDAHPEKIPYRPTIAWRSSNHHYQALWILDKPCPTSQIEKLNKAMSYACGADKSGWDLTQLLRIPGSYNFKYGEPQKCELMWDDGPTYDPDTLGVLTPDVDPKPASVVHASELSTDLESLTKPWRLSTRTRELIFAKGVPADADRSETLWQLEKLLIEHNIPVKQVIEIVRLTVWNKFAGRSNELEQLTNEILKAETEFRLDSNVSTLPKETKNKLITFDSFIGKDIDRLNFLVEGFVIEGSVGVTAGEPKTMKSTMMLDLAVSVASGNNFLGVYATKQVPVLYIQEENSEADIKARFLRIAMSREVITNTPLGIEPEPIPLYLINNAGMDLRNNDDRKDLEDTIQDYGIKLLILDPWYMLVSDLDENNAKDVGPILKYLTSLRNNYGCAVMLVHHFKKSESSRGGQRMRGSSVFHAWTESGLYVELNKGTPGDVWIEREFRGFPSAKDLNLVFTGDDTYYDVHVRTEKDTYVKPIKSSTTARTDSTFTVPALPDDAISIIDSEPSVARPSLKYTPKTKSTVRT